jgi:Ca2+-binding RTX toxin-like protein
MLSFANKLLKGRLGFPRRGTGSSPPRWRPRVESLEVRTVPAASIVLNGTTIDITGYDNPYYGENVTVTKLSGDPANPYDDAIYVELISQNGNLSKTVDLWKNSGGTWVPNVTAISYSGLAGDDSFNDQTSLPSSSAGGEGRDYLVGGTGNDYADGGPGDDTLFGGAGNDFLGAGQGTDYVDGQAGADTLYESYFAGGGAGVNNGNDVLVGGDGVDRVYATGDVNFSLNDTALRVAGLDNLALAEDGLVGVEQAILSGGNSVNSFETVYFTGSTIVYGGGGNDVVFSGVGRDTVYGGPGDDIIWGNDGDDALYGEDGNDYLAGGFGNDELRGGAGNDYLAGNTGNDFIYGGSGNDTLDGGDDNDYLAGEADGDTLYGGNGNDVLDGGAEHAVDYLYGQGGIDTFYRYKFATRYDYLSLRWIYDSDKVMDQESGEIVYTSGV